MATAIKYYYVILNDGLNLATPNREEALKRINQLLGMMTWESNKNWRIELSYGE